MRFRHGMMETELFFSELGDEIPSPLDVCSSIFVSLFFFLK